LDIVAWLLYPNVIAGRDCGAGASRPGLRSISDVWRRTSVSEDYKASTWTLGRFTSSNGFRGVVRERMLQRKSQWHSHVPRFPVLFLALLNSPRFQLAMQTQEALTTAGVTARKLH